MPNVLLVYPKFPLSYWGFQYAMDFVGRKACMPPLGLVYGSFSYPKETQEVKLGPLEFSMKEKQTVNVPVWAGVGAIVVGGGVLLLFAGKKS